ncbi:MAG: AGE family epimerase/isomerase [Parvularculaceae bacterium]|nr:AGE family epimerase/isomerase [Parvularculaceae bacterium]
MTGLPAAIDRLNEWHIRQVLPLWASAGVDERGGFFESLDFDGRPVAGQQRRVRVQCRQIHAFTDAALRGWLAAGETIAARGFARLLETACPDDGARGCVHALHDDGRVADRLRDLYDQAFLLLACAARIRATNDPVARGLADRTLAFLDREFASPHGGYRENDRGGLPRRQNPHMHLFEALTALYEATGETAYLERAGALDNLLRTRFIDRDKRALREYFNDDWSLIDRVSDAIEPGHMAEWAFLLDRWARRSGADRADEIRMLANAAANFIAPEDAPFLPGRALLGRPPQRAARRLWPQTERLRALLVLARDGDAGAAAAAARLIDALFQTYFSPPTLGLWRDEFDAEGAPIAKDVPASILYHIHEAVCCAADSADMIAA